LFRLAQEKLQIIEIEKLGSLSNPVAEELTP
jgi:hypothetical protein